MGETEFMVRGLGTIKGIEDLNNVPLGVDRRGIPILLRNVATVNVGPELRRGIADYDGEGEVVGGIIVMRYGENALTVIDNVKTRLAELKTGLPEGVLVKSVYDRSGLILRAVNNLKTTLIEEIVIVAIVCITFLFHFRSALVGIGTPPHQEPVICIELHADQATGDTENLERALGELAAGGAELQALGLLFSGDRDLWQIIGISFKVSITAMAIATPLAIAMAFLLAFGRFPGRRLLIVVFNTLLSFPAVVVGLTFYLLLSRQGPLGEWQLLFTQPAMVIGQIALALPILVAMGHASLQSVNRSAWETARTLGASVPRAVFTLLREARFGLLGEMRPDRLGETPLQRREARVKPAASANPSIRLISTSFRSASTSNASAFRNRLWSRIQL